MLPSSLLNILESYLNIKGINKVIRGLSNRDNISYRRIYYRGSDELVTIQNTLSTIISSDINTSNKILIFITSTTKGKDLSSTLNYPFIYSKLSIKEAILADFISSSTS